MEKRENDMFINLMVNPTFNMEDFSKVGLTSDNTSIQTKDVYLQSDKIKANPLFQDDKGNFDQSKFDKVYETAQNQLQGLSAKQFTEDVAKDWEMYRGDIFAPEERRKPKDEPEIEIKRIQNPFRQQMGFVTTGMSEDPTKSIREIAQSSNVDSEGNYVESANDSGFWANLFNPKVYATWDEAGEHIDPITGETVQHQKGEYKLNKEGTFYTEDLDGRNVYDKEIVSAFDTITVDGSTWNKYDFLDSDDKKKSFGGSLMKAVAQVAPAFIPGVGEWYIGSRVLLSMAEVIPAVLNSVGGVAGGIGVNNPVTNWLQGVNKAASFSVSDYSQGSSGYQDLYKEQGHVFSWENNLKMIADVFTQLAEQRWLFEKGTSIFSGINKEALVNQKAKEAWLDDYIAKNNIQLFSDAGQAAAISRQGEAAIMSTGVLTKKEQLIQAQKAFNDLTKHGRKISEAISQAYMTGITTASAFNEAKNAGATDLEAALFTAGYTFGEWKLLSTDLGKWILPELKQERMAHKNLARTLGAIKDETKNANTQEGKRSLGKRLFEYGKSLVTGDYSDSVLASTAKTALSHMAAEATEEVSEELLLDLSKVAFNLGTAALGGKGKFEGIFDDALERYTMSALGGAIGGGIGSIHSGAYKYFKQAKNLSMDQAFAQLVDIVKEGQEEEFLRTADKMTLGDKTHSFMTDNDGNYQQADANNPSQDQQIKKLLREQVKLVKDILEVNGADLSQDGLIANLTDAQELRKEIRYLNLRESSMLGMYVQDYNNAVQDLVANEIKLKQLEAPVSDQKGENEQATKDRSEEIAKVKEDIKKNKEIIESYKDGTMKNEFLKDTLFVMESHIANAFAPTNFKFFAEKISGKKWEDLTKQERIDLEQQYIDNRGDIREKIHEGRVIYERLSYLFGDVLRNHEDKYFQKEGVDVKRDLTVDDDTLEGQLLRSETANKNKQESRVIPSIEGQLNQKNKSGVNSVILRYLLKKMGDQDMLNTLEEINAYPIDLQELSGNTIFSGSLSEIQKEFENANEKDREDLLKSFINIYNKAIVRNSIARIKALSQEIEVDEETVKKAIEGLERVYRLENTWERGIQNELTQDEADAINEINGGASSYGFDEADISRELTYSNFFKTVQEPELDDTGAPKVDVDGKPIMTEVVITRPELDDLGNVVIDPSTGSPIMSTNVQIDWEGDEFKRLFEKEGYLKSINDLLYEANAREWTSISNSFINKHYDELKKLIDDESYITPFVKTYLHNFLDSIEDLSLDINKDKKKQLNESIDKTSNSPIFELLNEAITKLADEKVDVSELLTDLSSSLQKFAIMANLGDFSYDEDVDKRIRKTKDLIDVLYAILNGARSEIFLDINQVNGFNATFNEINGIQFDRTKPEDANAKVKALPTVNYKVVDTLLYELNKIRQQLSYYERIYEINSSQTLTEHNQINVKTAHMIQNNLRRFIVSIPNDDTKYDQDSVNELREAINNAEIINQTLGQRTQLNQEELEKLFAEELNIKRAIFNFFNNEKNKKTLEDPKNFIELFDKEFDLVGSDMNSALNINTSSQPDAEFLFYLATASAVNPDAVYNEYKESIGGKFAAIRSQEDSIIRAYAFILNQPYIEKFIKNYNELFKAQVDAKRATDKAFAQKYNKYDLERYISSVRQYFIDGVAGSGKSSAVLSTLKTMLETYHPALLKKVIFVSNTKTNAKNMAKESGFDEQTTTTMSKAEYMDHIAANYKQPKYDPVSGRIEVDTSNIEEDEETGIMHYKDIKPNTTREAPSLVIIDEATSLSQQDALLNDEWLSAMGCVAILAGDFNQIGADGQGKVGENQVLTIGQYPGNYFRNWKIGSCIRGNNGLAVQNNDVIRTNISEIAAQLSIANPSKKFQLSYYEDDEGTLYGSKIIETSFDEAKERIDKLLEYIYKYNQQVPPEKKERLNYIGDDLAKTSGLQQKVYDYLNQLNSSGKYAGLVNFTNSGASQGQEGLYYIINLAREATQDIEENQIKAKTLYTIISRSKQGSLIIGKEAFNGVLESVEVNRLVKKNLSPEVKQDFSNKRKQAIEKVVDKEAKTDGPNNVKKNVGPDNPPPPPPPDNPPTPPDNPVDEPYDVEENDYKNNNIINNPDKVLDSLQMIVHSSIVHNTGGSFISTDEHGNTILTGDPRGSDVFLLGKHHEDRFDSMNGLVKLYNSKRLNVTLSNEEKRDFGKQINFGSNTRTTIRTDAALKLLNILERIRAIASESTNLAEARREIREFFVGNVKIHLAYKSQSDPEVTEQYVADNSSNPNSKNIYKFYEDLEEERQVGIINNSNTSKEIQQPAKKYLELVITDESGNLLLEVPFAKMTSPMTAVHVDGLGFKALEPIYNRCIDPSNGKIDLDKFRSELEKVKDAGGNIRADAQMMIRMLDIYHKGSNYILFLNRDNKFQSLEPTRFDRRPSIGITIAKLNDNGRRVRGSYQDNNLSYYFGGEYITVEEYAARQPGRWISGIRTMTNDGFTLTNNDKKPIIESGRPFILMSDSKEFSSDEKALEAFIKQENTPNAPKHIKLVYLVPPSSEFDEYLINLNKAMTNKRSNKDTDVEKDKVDEDNDVYNEEDAVDKELGNPYTQFRLLIALASNKEAWDNVVKNGDYAILGRKEDYSRIEHGYENTERRLEKIRNFLVKLGNYAKDIERQVEEFRKNGNYEEARNKKRELYNLLRSTMEDAHNFLVSKGIISNGDPFFKKVDINGNESNSSIYKTQSKKYTLKQWCNSTFRSIMLKRHWADLSKVEIGIEKSGGKYAISEFVKKRLEELQKCTTWKNIQYHVGLADNSTAVTVNGVTFVEVSSSMNAFNGKYSIGLKSYLINGRMESAPIISDVSDIINFIFDGIQQQGGKDSIVKRTDFAQYTQEKINSNGCIDIDINYIVDQFVDKIIPSKPGINDILYNNQDLIKKELKERLCDALSNYDDSILGSGMFIDYTKNFGGEKVPDIFNKILTMELFNITKRLGDGQLVFRYLKEGSTRSTLISDAVDDKNAKLISFEGNLYIYGSDYIVKLVPTVRNKKNVLDKIQLTMDNDGDLINRMLAQNPDLQGTVERINKEEIIGPINKTERSDYSDRLLNVIRKNRPSNEVARNTLIKYFNDSLFNKKDLFSFATIVSYAKEALDSGKLTGVKMGFNSAIDSLYDALSKSKQVFYRGMNVAINDADFQSSIKQAIEMFVDEEILSKLNPVTEEEPGNKGNADLEKAKNILRNNMSAIGDKQLLSIIEKLSEKEKNKIKTLGEFDETFGTISLEVLKQNLNKSENKETAEILAKEIVKRKLNSLTLSIKKSEDVYNMFKAIFSEMGISELSPDDMAEYLRKPENKDKRKEVLERGSKLLSSLDILNNLTCQ